MQHNLDQVYRPEIDGLRAVSIISVVGYHAFPEFFPGGFVGVDVFFVISGYLISNIIFASTINGRFSFGRFYARRLFRIVPDLLLILFVCLVAGRLLLFPDEFASLGKHIAGGSAFVLNFLLWFETGYFDTAAATKPLLHLWSLSIEEQFYLIWPVFIFLMWKSRISMRTGLLCMLVASFSLNIYIAQVSPNAAFYLPITRFWELLLGGLISCLEIVSAQSQKQKVSFFHNHVWQICRLSPVNEVISGFGLLLIISSVLLLDKTSAAAGLSAILPALGAAALIGVGRNAWVSRRILATSVPVAVGLISYPLYLWHWPLLSFLSIVSTERPNIIMRALTIGFSVCLAWLTYRYFETPIRYSKKTVKKTLLLIVNLAFLCLVGLVIFSGNAMAQVNAVDDLAMDGSKVKYNQCPAYLIESDPRITYCLQSKPDQPIAAIFGDSHADHLFHGIAKLDSENSWLLIGSASCPPLRDVQLVGDQPQCREKVEKIIQHLSSHAEIRTVVLSFFGNYFLDTNFAADHVSTGVGPKIVKINGAESLSEKRELYSQGLEQTVVALEKAKKNIVIVIDVPELPFSPRSCISRFPSRAITKCFVSRSIVNSRQKDLYELMSKLKARHPLIHMFDPAEYLCDSEKCSVAMNDRLLYRDSHHLSLFGGELIAKPLLKLIQTIEPLSK